MWKALVLSSLLLLSPNTSFDETMPRVDLRQLDCLARNIYHEARGESVEGKLAVAFVTLNRTIDDVCKTVYKRKQFSWTMNVPGIYEKDAWYDANLVAYHAVVTYDQQNFMATHYHAKSVKPVWRKRLVKLAEIGNHVFYR